MNTKKIILASSSPRRRELLDSVGLDFSVVASDFIEDNELNVPPAELVKQLALGKAQWVAKQHPDAIVIGADTVISFNGQIFGKPGDKDGVIDSLSTLSGKTHSVLTGFAILNGSQIIVDVVETKVTIRDLSQEEIAAYAQTGEGTDKAGGYAIQGIGALLMDHIEGDYFNVVGLPLSRLAVRLRESGVAVLA